MDRLPATTSSIRAVADQIGQHLNRDSLRDHDRLGTAAPAGGE
jgi:hypothetical protein